MKFQRRQFLRLALGAAALSPASRMANAQAYPSRPVRLVIGYTPGGSADLTARLMGQWLSERLGQSFVIENRPGGGTNIATESVVRAAPDGYTLLLAAPANAINATLYDKLNFDFLRDIEPIAGIIRFPNVVVVNPSLPIKSIPELIAYAKANPGKLNMASSGNGSTIHMSGELFKMLTGINMVHVPYRGGAPALTDLLAGQVQVMFDNIPTCAEHVKSGKLRGLAVTSTTRSEVLPDLPTVADFLPGYEASAWYGIGAPKNTPPRNRRDAEQGRSTRSLPIPRRRRGLPNSARILLPGSAADFWKLLADETEKWGKVVKFVGRQGGLGRLTATITSRVARRGLAERSRHRRYQRLHEEGVVGREMSVRRPCDLSSSDTTGPTEAIGVRASPSRNLRFASMRPRDLDQAAHLARIGQRDRIDAACRHLVDRGDDVGVGGLRVIDIGQHGIDLGALRLDRADQHAVILVRIELQAEAMAAEIDARQHLGDAFGGRLLRRHLRLQPDLAQRPAGFWAAREFARLAERGDEIPARRRSGARPSSAGAGLRRSSAPDRRKAFR